jgi:hypothetical protein
VIELAAAEKRHAHPFLSIGGNELEELFPDRKLEDVSGLTTRASRLLVRGSPHDWPSFTRVFLFPNRFIVDELVVRSGI